MSSSWDVYLVERGGLEVDVSYDWESDPILHRMQDHAQTAVTAPPPPPKQWSEAPELTFVKGLLAEALDEPPGPRIGRVAGAGGLRPGPREPGMIGAEAERGLLSSSRCQGSCRRAPAS